MEFIRGKVREDHKALTLIKAGYKDGFEGEAYSSVSFQSTNLSVRLDDYFFEQLEKGGNVQLRQVKSGNVVEEISADIILKEISFGSWRIGDPAVQYENEIDRMNTVSNTDRINSSNPCSEYMFLDNTSCNLNSLNLLKFSDKKGNFDIEAFNRATRIMTIAGDISNDAASYPNKNIAKLSPEFRTIGVGYANLGALLMRKSIAYDSNEGRAIAAAITATMHGEVMRTSAEMAKGLEPFIHYEFNKNPMKKVMERHRNSVFDIGKREDLYGENFDINSVKGLQELINAGGDNLDEAISIGDQYGYRNAQGTVLAPTGTIAFLMGCDTTGVEPAIALTISKKLAGGGHMDLPVKEIGNSLNNLGYVSEHISDIEDYVAKNKTADGAPHLKEEHQNIFDTAFTPELDKRFIDFDGHVKMLGATQPFISGAISKTNNFPKSATVKDVYDGFILGQKLGLKALAVFRDKSKPTAALDFDLENDLKSLVWGEKRDLPSQRSSFETEFSIGGSRSIHLIISEYDDGTPGQIVFEGYKSGTALSSFLAMAGIQASKSLKRGNPLEVIIDGWKGHKTDVASGFVTGDPWIKNAASPVDYAAKFLELHYLGNLDIVDNNEDLDITKLRGYESGAFETYARKNIDDWNFDDVINDYLFGGFIEKKESSKVKTSKKKGNNSKINKDDSGRPCGDCGSIMIRTKPGCYECHNCFDTQGGCG
jgi:ribonucleoside-diphosphate reductase alpha chain